MDETLAARIKDNMNIAARCAKDLYDSLVREGFSETMVVEIVKSAMVGYLRSR